MKGFVLVYVFSLAACRGAADSQLPQQLTLLGTTEEQGTELRSHGQYAVDGTGAVARIKHDLGARRIKTHDDGVLGFDLGVQLMPTGSQTQWGSTSDSSEYDSLSDEGDAASYHGGANRSLQVPNALLRKQKRLVRIHSSHGTAANLIRDLNSTNISMNDTANGTSTGNTDSKLANSLTSCVMEGPCVINGGFDAGLDGSLEKVGVPLGWQGYPSEGIAVVSSNNEVQALDGGHFLALRDENATLLQMVTGLVKNNQYELSFQATCGHGAQTGEILSVDVGGDVSLQNIALPVRKFKNITLRFVAASDTCVIKFSRALPSSLRMTRLLTNKANVSSNLSSAVLLDNVKIGGMVVPPPKKKPYMICYESQNPNVGPRDMICYEQVQYDGSNQLVRSPPILARPRYDQNVGLGGRS